jgi:predicted DNA-binding protein (MmcQ/YjbR family)
MNIENICAYCLDKKGVKEDFPFDEVTLTMKVMGKIFAFIPLDTTPLTIALKCDPEYALELRDTHEDIGEAYHLNKKHWISVACEATLSDNLIKSLIDDSYALVVKGLKKSEKEALLIMEHS